MGIPVLRIKTWGRKMWQKHRRDLRKTNFKGFNFTTQNTTWQNMHWRMIYLFKSCSYLFKNCSYLFKSCSSERIICLATFRQIKVPQALQPPSFCLTHTYLVNVRIQGVVVIQLIPFVFQLLIQDTVHGIKHLPLKFHFWNENLSWKHMQWNKDWENKSTQPYTMKSSHGQAQSCLESQKLFSVYKTKKQDAAWPLEMINMHLSTDHFLRLAGKMLFPSPTAQL